MAQTLIVLGTGNALATRCYNTCFAVEFSCGEILLVDAGGGNGILRQLDEAHINAERIEHIILTHAHCDHMLGLVWMVRKIGTLMRTGAYDGVLSIHCSEKNALRLRAMCEATLEGRFVSLFDERIVFAPVTDGDTHGIYGTPVTFFDIRSTKEQQYGFTMPLEQGGKLTCLGDEPYNPACRDYAAGADWLLSEAFCLYADRDRFRPYEKHHSTARDAAMLAAELGVRHLVLWHTEDKTFDTRKQAYGAEAAGYFSGQIHVPWDLERLTLEEPGRSV